MTTLDTVDQVSEAIAAENGITAAELRAMKPLQRQLRAGRLADLYEIRARLFAEMDLSLIPQAALNDVAMARARAAQADRDSARFWRNEASAR